MIGEQVREERDTKESLERRGLAVITTSGVLVSLLFALGAIVTDSPDFSLPLGSRRALIAALVAFVVAGICGVMCNVPRLYPEGASESLYRLTSRETWEARHAIGSRRAARLNVAILTHAREVNSKKAKWLRRAMVVEVVAVALVGIAIGGALVVGTPGTPRPTTLSVTPST